MMHQQKTRLSLVQLLVLGTVVAMGACASDPGVNRVDAGSDRPAGWGLDSHGAGAEPDYPGLFADETIGAMKVHRFDLIIEQGAYDETLADLESLFGTCGGGGGPGGPGPGGPGGAVDDPIWIPVEVQYEGKAWTHVGMRYKGNSSLQSAWRSCTKKLSFRLDFDQFESEYPAIDNQRFFGFKKMTFSNGFKDSSLIRDKLGADIFRRAGVPSARGAFAQVFVSIGTAAPVYFGLYTMIEDPSNRMLDSQFGDDGGNLYKPESQWGAQLSGSNLQTEFEKKSNEDAADWSDMESLLAVLHASNRLTDAAAWRAALEQHLDVPGYLRWLALNQAMVNWDTYGCMAHNYYVYADPSDATAAAPNGRFTWFPWDLNESLLVGGRCNLAGTEGLIPGPTQISSAWPLVRYLLDDPIYVAAYREELEAAVATGGGFDSAWIKERIAGYHDLIAPFVVGPVETEQAGYTFLNSTQAFADSAAELQAHVDARKSLVNQVLGL